LSPLYGGFSSRKAANFWTQRDEQSSFAVPVFAPDHYEALRAIRARSGLDYFSIDCAIDDRGDCSCSRSTPRCWCTRTMPSRVGPAAVSDAPPLSL
jgi:hypothetical protein